MCLSKQLLQGYINYSTKSIVNKKGYLISFEGGEGAGKTTIIHELSDYLRTELKLPVVSYREPGGTNIGDQIRHILHSLENEDLTDRAELLLYMASRAQGSSQILRPLLEEGNIILVDRYIDSSIAYQGHARGIGASRVSSFNDFATSNLVPDLTLLFDISPKEGLDRIYKSEDREVNRMDSQLLEFYEKVDEAYQALYKHDYGVPPRWERVDATKSIEEVFEETKNIIESRLISADLLEGNLTSKERRG